MSDFFSDIGPDNLPEAFVYSEYFSRDDDGQGEEIQVKPPSKLMMAIIYIFVAILLLSAWINT